MKILKRNGVLELMDIKKIQKQTADATAGIAGVSQSELELDSQIQFRDGMTSVEVQDTLIKTAVQKIDIDVPGWTYTGARLFVYDLFHRVGATIGGEKGKPYSHIEKYLSYGESQNRIIKGLKEKFNLEKINDAIKPERDFLFTYLGIKTLADRYLLKNLDGEYFELPQHMFMGIAMFIAQKEHDFNDAALEAKFLEKFGSKNENYVKEAKTYWAMKFYEIISSHEVMLATPTLSNARTLRHQLSSCYIGSTPDKIEGIFDSYLEMALLSKYGGGIGWDWNKVRGLGGAIDDHKNAAGGTIPFLKIANDTAIAVDQLGTRKGAIAVYMETYHRDILDFLDLKKNSGEERRRAHDLFPSLWINDLFMERVINNESWTLFSPEDTPELSELYGEDFNTKYKEYELDATIPKETIMAKDIWKKVLTQYFETGSPFLCFKDTANRVNPNSHAGHIRSSNLCTEIFQNTSPNKYLTKIQFTNGEIHTAEEESFITVDGGVEKKAKHVTALDTIDGKEIYIVEKEKIDGETAVCNLASVNLSKINTREDMERVVPTAIRMLDNVIDLNFYPLKKVKDTNLRTRAIGLGVMGEAQMVAESGLKWGTMDHLKKVDEIMETFSFQAINASADIAIKKGAYPNFEGSKWSKGIMPKDHANDATKDLTGNNEHEYCTDGTEIWNDWRALRAKVQKTGIRNGYLMAVAPTSSISILVGTTQAIEPVYKRKWFEENLSGLIPVVAPNLSPETWEGYTPAFDVDPLDVVKAAAVRQKWLDQGQSTNIFIKIAGMSGKKLNDIYVSAWEYGLKSTYYLRSQSPEYKEEVSEEVSEEDVVDRSMECSGCQ